MGAGHAHPLHLDRPSPVHALAPEVKILATLLFTVVVVATPRTEFLAFGGYALLLAAVTVLARVPVGWLAKRATIELPFVVLAVALPFAGHGERITWLGLSLSVDGLYGAWNIAAKGTLGVIASLLLAASSSEATTPSVPLAAMFHAPCSPSTDSDRPSQVTRSPWPANGSAMASTMNGSSMVARRASHGSGTRARTVTAASSRA